MAGAGAKLFQDGQKLFAADMNEYLMDQTIMRFADAAARDAAFGGVGEPTLAEGMMCYLMDVNVIQVYDGSSWKYVANADQPTGMVKITPTSVAGTGVSILSNGSVQYSSVTGTGGIINGIFSSAFTNYRIIYNVTGTSAGGYLRWRAIVGGSVSSGNYTTVGNGSFVSGGTQNGVAIGTGNQNVSFGYIGNLDTPSCTGGGVADFYNPNANLTTHANFCSAVSAGGSGLYNAVGATTHIANAQLTGIELSVASGNWSGVVHIYGIKDS